MTKFLNNNQNIWLKMYYYFLTVILIMEIRITDIGHLRFLLLTRRLGPKVSYHCVYNV